MNNFSKKNKLLQFLSLKTNFLFLFFFIAIQFSSLYAQVITNPSSDPNYDIQKAALINPASGKSLKQNKKLSNQIVGNTTRDAVVNAVACYFPPDNTYSTFAGNDDGSIGPFALPFAFKLYGTSYNQVWINNNGNVTFAGAFGTFTPEGFPMGVPMVAAFWGDVDTRSGNLVRYKINPTNMIITFPSVGYYSLHLDKLNTFQIIITNGNDPLIGIGNNVAFYYGDMQWTTGDASGGSGGFGGSPATVGVNKGNSIDYVQVGRFGVPGSAYDGGGGATDGVDYLDNQCFTFDVSGTVGSSNLPPSVSGAPSGNVVNLTCGQTQTITLQFLPPEINQLVSTVINTGGLCNTTTSITNGAVSTASLTITGAACNVGSNIISFTATDNFASPASTIVNITVNVAACPVSDTYYSKSSGDLHNVLTWGLNPDGSGANPSDFNDSTFQLANRPNIYTMTADWIVGGIINIPAASQLQVNGNTLSLTNLAGTGTITGSVTSNVTVLGTSGGGVTLNFTPAGNLLNNFTVNRTGAGALVTIGSALNILNVLTSTNGLLNTSGLITLKSNASTTARVAPVLGSITGNVTVERYIPARRAWRLLAAPVGGNQTINQAWQEGATTFSANPNPAPGFGTHITQSVSSGADGLDFNSAIAMSSLKRHQNSNNTWVPVLNTNSTLVNSNAWFIFVRGDRSINMGYNTVAPNTTVLRSNGPLKTGDQAFPVAASGLTAVPNPYASPLNFASIAANNTNIANSFTVVDPKLGSTGAFVNVSFNGVSYDVTPAAVSPITELIQSGQGFLVQSTGAAGSIVIRESDKSATAATNVFRTSGSPIVSSTNTIAISDPAAGTGLRVNLQTVNDDRTTLLLDEVFSSYSNNYSEKIDNMDAIKMDNTEENLGLVREGRTFMLERKPLPVESDVILLKMWNLTRKNYILEVNPINLAGKGLFAYLEDKFLKTSIPISLDKPFQVYFTITGDVASTASNRFQIILSRKVTGELTVAPGKSSITAFPNPITAGTISLLFSNKPAGTYQATLRNSLGQVVFSKSIQYRGGTATQVLPLGKKLVNGSYQLQISHQEGITNIPVISN